MVLASPRSVRIHPWTGCASRPALSSTASPRRPPGRGGENNYDRLLRVTATYDPDNVLPLRPVNEDLRDAPCAGHMGDRTIGGRHPSKEGQSRLAYRSTSYP
jgi:Berberine and berberine like